MKRPATKIVVAAALVGAAMVGIQGARVAMKDEAACGVGFRREGPRCLPPREACPPPLSATGLGCDAPARDVVVIPATRVAIGPSDWEAEGRVKPRMLDVPRFAIDRLEVTVGRAFCPGCSLADPARFDPSDLARAASSLTFAEARAFCAALGGRLPSEDEWIVAAAGDRPRRYPWGDTGAVCRRAAWGLVKGPCGKGASGPDTVGAHPDGATPLGVHDLAGNVAEWVEGPSAPGQAAVRGGSFDTELATELRTWPRREVPAAVRHRSVGFRCAYDVP